MKRYSILVALLIVGCSVDPSKTTVNPYSEDPDGGRQSVWNALIGSWRGSQATIDGDTYEWVMTQFNNGKYVLEGRLIGKDGAEAFQMEVGEWGASGNIKFTIFKGWLKGDECVPSDPRDPTNYDAYEVVSITSTEIVYRNLDNESLFVAKKVEDNDNERLINKAGRCFEAQF